MSKLKSKAPLGASLVVLSSVFYASYGVWTTLMGDFFGGYTASALRSVTVLLIIVPFAMYFKKLEAVNWQKNWKLIVAMTVASTLVWGPLYFAVLEAGIGVALTINYAAIVIGMFFFGWLLSNEKITKDKTFSAILGIVGIWLVFTPSVAEAGWLAPTATIVSGLAIALVSVSAKKLPYNATSSTIMLWVSSVIANIPMAFILREALPSIGLHVEWGYLVLFAVASVLASLLLIRGIKLIDAGAAGVLGLLEIVFAVIFGVLFFNERIDDVAYVGIATILLASAIPYVIEYRKSLQS